MAPEGWVSAAGQGAGALQALPVQAHGRRGCHWGADEIFQLLFCSGVFAAVLGLFLASFQLL